MAKKMTTADFIKRAREVHGDLYDYSKVDYVNEKTKVTIICPIHKEFLQRPGNHLLGRGCQKCAGKGWTTEDFISEAKKVHGDLYDYSKVDYKGKRQKVCIIDPDYGEFLQVAGVHLKGHGNKERAIYNARLKTTKSQKDFIKDARNIHGDLYNYDDVIYKGAKEYVDIICKEHGLFKQTPDAHINGGAGCPKCYGRDKTTEDIINNAKKVHGDLYDYSKAIYTGVDNKICIIDPVYGEFWQTPYNHINGKQGHPSRASSGFDPYKPAILYYLKIMNGVAYKIGITNRTVEERFRKDMDFIEIIKIWSYPLGIDAQKEEQRILNEFKDAKYDGSSLLKDGNDELFRYDILGLDTK